MAAVVQPRLVHEDNGWLVDLRKAGKKNAVELCRRFQTRQGRSVRQPSFLQKRVPPMVPTSSRIFGGFRSPRTIFSSKIMGHWGHALNQP